MPENATMDRPAPEIPDAWKLPPETAAALAALESDLRVVADAFRERWEDKSDRWRESGKGESVDVWIEALHELADALDATDAEPE